MKGDANNFTDEPSPPTESQQALACVCAVAIAETNDTLST